jgi:hypothetical protein
LDSIESQPRLFVWLQKSSLFLAGLIHTSLTPLSAFRGSHVLEHESSEVLAKDREKIPKEHAMNQEQFGQFWQQLRTLLKVKWEKITTEDLDEIQGDLATFGSVLKRRYGELHQEEVTTWANRRYSTWTGRKSAKNVSQGKGHALSRPPSGGVTCNELQVDEFSRQGNRPKRRAVAFTCRNSPSEGANKMEGPGSSSLPREISRLS